MIKRGELMKLESLYRYNAQKQKVRRISFKDYDKFHAFSTSNKALKAKNKNSAYENTATQDDSFKAFDARVEQNSNSSRAKSNSE